MLVHLHKRQHDRKLQNLQVFFLSVLFCFLIRTVVAKCLKFVYVNVLETLSLSWQLEKMKNFDLISYFCSLLKMNFTRKCLI